MYKRILFIFSFVLIFILSFTVTSFASSTVSVPYAEPSCDTTQGYLVTKRDSGYVDTFYWSVTPVSKDPSVPNSIVSATIDNNRVVFTMGGTSGVTYYATLVHLNTTSNVYVRFTGSFVATETVSYTFSNGNVVEFSARGNIGTLTNNIGSSANLSVQFGSNTSLTNIANILNNSNAALLDIKGYLVSFDDYFTDSSGTPYIYSINSQMGTISSQLNSLLSLMNNSEDGNFLDKYFQKLNAIQNSIDISNSYLNTFHNWLYDTSSGVSYFYLYNQRLNNIVDELVENNNYLKTFHNWLYDTSSDVSYFYLYNQHLKNINSELVENNDFLRTFHNWWYDTSSGVSYFYLYNNRFKDIVNQLDEANGSLAYIIDILEEFRDTQLDESTEPLPNDDLNDYEDTNSSLRNDSDVSTDLDSIAGGFNGTVTDFFPFSNGFRVIWDLVDSVLGTHSMLFSLVTLVLSIGLVSLIFNRR